MRQKWGGDRQHCIEYLSTWGGGDGLPPPSRRVESLLPLNYTRICYNRRWLSHFIHIRRPYPHDMSPHGRLNSLRNKYLQVAVDARYSQYVQENRGAGLEAQREEKGRRA